MIIRTEHLAKSYRGRKVVNDVSLHIETGQVVGLLGPNGAGKTTTFYMIVGLIKPQEGRVFLDDKEITRMPMYVRARSGIGYLPQEASVFRRLTVEENLRLVLEMQDRPRKEQDKRIEELMHDLGMSHLRNSIGGSLSGGERRRVEIARALACDPKFILLDEPFTGIDPRTIEELQAIILKLAERGIGILITDHNVGATLGITDHNYILVDGKIIAQGERQAIVSNPEVRKHYLGEQFK
ncbi:MAG TPA: LPS export ABC transporter ATP-binding protein [Fimbriimonadales bacterium]|nr:LPS export ABC transporter ATP-binding protein [Fimbriimonadales bacterium]